LKSVSNGINHLRVGSVELVKLNGRVGLVAGGFSYVLTSFWLTQLQCFLNRQASGLARQPLTLDHSHASRYGHRGAGQAVAARCAGAIAVSEYVSVGQTRNPLPRGHWVPSEVRHVRKLWRRQFDLQSLLFLCAK
jgi:hypothetical protein